MARIISILLTVCLAVTVSAQDSLRLHDYQFVKQSDPWLCSTNAAALTRFAYQNMAQAELSLGGERGGFTNYNESDDVTQVHAGVESYYRVSPVTVVFGQVNYDHFSGRHMGGSAFIHPERQPFDLVEDSLTNTGTKHRDTYHLTGAFGTQLTRRLALGMLVDYTAANYAKYKDLRHQNKLMDLQLSAGLYAPVNEWLNLGAHYLYHRNTESITFGTYGTSDKVYKTMVSYANFTGLVEQFGSEGYTDKSREMPLVTDMNGLGLQLSCHAPHPNIHLFAAYDFTHGNGYYGRKSPYTVTYSKHRTDEHRLHLRLDHMQTEQARQQLDFNMKVERLKNEATTHREQQNEAGATYYYYYTPVKTADKEWRDYHLLYTLYMGICQQALPTWTVQAGVQHRDRRQTAYVFPFYRRQHLHNTEGTLLISHNIIKQKGYWTLTLQGSYLKGHGTPYEDHYFQMPSDKQPLPPSMDAYLYREYQWLTASQFGVGSTVEYHFMMPGTQLNTHAGISIHHRQANEHDCYTLGRHHTKVALTLGCAF